ncbi:MAG: cupredoxin domain-containing protein [Pseudomonadota bacterium]
MNKIVKITVVAVSVLALGFAVFYSVFLEKPKGDVEVRLTLQDHKFDRDEIKIPAGKPFVIVFTNNDAMPEEAEFMSLRVEKMVAPHSEARLQMRALRPGRYELIGEYHPDTAKMIFIAE